MSKREPLTAEEEMELINTAEEISPIHEFTVRVLLHTGLRASEFAHMKDSWVDWKNSTVRVPEEEGGWTPKTDAAVRSIPIAGDPATFRRMKWYFKHNESVGITRQQVHRRVKDVAEQTNIRKKVSPHILRHTFGTRVAKHGDGDAQLICQMLGHEDLSSASPYLQYDDEYLAKQAEEIWGGTRYSTDG